MFIFMVLYYKFMVMVISCVDAVVSLQQRCTIVCLSRSAERMSIGCLEMMHRESSLHRMDFNFFKLRIRARQEYAWCNLLLEACNFERVMVSWPLN